jgi:outer membrane protein TolC
MYQRQQQTLLLTAKIRDHIEKAYRAGVATLTRLNEAQTDLVRAAGAEAASRINYLLALQQLKAASGRILDDEGGKGGQSVQYH